MPLAQCLPRSPLRTARALPLALVILGGLPTPAPAATSDAPPTRIVFHTLRWGALPQIALVKPDGTDLSRLTYTDAYEQCAAVSPDGTRIAFESTRDGVANRLMVMNGDGSDQHRLTTQPNEEAHAAWAKDGLQIGCSAVFGGTIAGGGTYDICAMNADGTNVRRLTTDPAHDLVPDWSPDGSRILFTSQRDGIDQIYIMDSDGGGQRRLIATPQSAFLARWSPDGSRIAYVEVNPHTLREVIHVMNADTTGDVAITDSTYDSGGLSWSPDGSRLAFTTGRYGSSSTPDVFTMKPDGTDWQRVTAGAIFDYYPSWGPAPLDARIHLASEASGREVHLRWNASPWPGVLRYDVYRGTVAQQQLPTLAGSTTDTTLTDSVYPGTFYYRVRAVRATDQSLYSNEDTLTVCARTAVYAYAGSSPVAPLVADLDQDGRPDLAVANALTSGTVSVLRGLGADAFAAPVAFPAGAKPSGLGTADFDRDGRLDLAVANDATSGTVSLLRGLGAGAFATPVAFAVDSRPSALITGDFDEDGIPDLAVSCRGGDSVCLLLGLGSGGVGTGSFAPAVSYATVAQPVALVGGDFDRDGVIDLAVLGGGGGQLSVLRGQGAYGHGNGSFAPAVDYSVAAPPCAAIATGDFDQDGFTDLAVTLATSTNGVALLRGLGDGTFAAPTRFAAGSFPTALAVCDFDGDGLADLVHANATGSTISVLPGRGDATFAAPIGVAVGGSSSGLALGDFGPDSLPDLACTSLTGSSTLTLFPGACPPGVPARVRLFAPDGGESWPVGTEQVVAWERDPGVVAVDLELSRDGGARWECIAADLTATSFAWTVTGPLSADARLRVHDSGAWARGDQSATPFTIATNVAVPTATVPRHELSLEGSLPSPARGSLAVAFCLPDDAPATLELLDLAGRRLAARQVGDLGPGRHLVTLAPGPTLPPGVHFLRLRHDGRLLVRRVVLLR